METVNTDKIKKTTFENGDEYVGENSGQPNYLKQGLGFYAFLAEGQRYIGGWKDDDYHGTGTLTYSDGTIQTGVWVTGQLVED